MAVVPIICIDCGAGYEAGRKDATRCPPCRLLKVLTYAQAKFKGLWKCKACGEKFRPAGKATRLCGTCDVPYKSAVVRQCKVCKTEAPDYEKVPVCLPCVKDPKQQQIVVRGLKNGQRTRRAANRDTVPART